MVNGTAYQHLTKWSLHLPLTTPCHGERMLSQGIHGPIAVAVGLKVLESPTHQFSTGERLRLSAVLGDGRRAAGCKIISLVPYEGYGSLRYKVRSDSEQFERVVPEGDLKRS